jgi:hypothetical protein
MKRLAFVVAVAVVVVGGVLLWRERQELGDGPVFAGTTKSATSQRLAVGVEYSIGHALLRNRGSEAATIERVRLLGVSDGLELLGVYSRPVPDEQERGMFLGDFGFPPAQWPSKPLAEQNVVPVAKTFTESGEPGEGLELVIGVKATRPGVARARAIEFTYRIGDRRYREEYEGAIYLCAPMEQFTSETCPGKAEGHFSDEVAG